MQDTYADLSERVEFLERMEEGLGAKFADLLREEIKGLRTLRADGRHRRQAGYANDLSRPARRQFRHFSTARPW